MKKINCFWGAIALLSVQCSYGMEIVVDTAEFYKSNNVPVYANIDYIKAQYGTFFEELKKMVFNFTSSIVGEGRARDFVLSIEDKLIDLEVAMNETSTLSSLTKKSDEIKGDFAHDATLALYNKFTNDKFYSMLYEKIHCGYISSMTENDLNELERQLKACKDFDMLRKIKMIKDLKVGAQAGTLSSSKVASGDVHVDQLFADLITTGAHRLKLRVLPLEDIKSVVYPAPRSFVYEDYHSYDGSATAFSVVYENDNDINSRINKIMGTSLAFDGGVYFTVQRSSNYGSEMFKPHRLFIPSGPYSWSSGDYFCEIKKYASGDAVPDVTLGSGRCFSTVAPSNPQSEFTKHNHVDEPDWTYDRLSPYTCITADTDGGVDRVMYSVYVDKNGKSFASVNVLINTTNPFDYYSSSVDSLLYGSEKPAVSKPVNANIANRVYEIFH